jgi:Uncharacterized conserved protein (DUF2358)
MLVTGLWWTVVRGLALPIATTNEGKRRAAMATNDRGTRVDTPRSLTNTLMWASRSDLSEPTVDDMTTTAAPSSSNVATSKMTSAQNEAALLALLEPWEQWLARHVKRSYERALAIKCPFFRRRAADLLDASDQVLRFIIYRHKSLPWGPPGWKCHNDETPKQIGLYPTELLQCLRRDWKVDTHKGYYVTGKLTTSIYRDDVVFDGPDPDMPVRGLRKYLNAASQLFEQSQSRAELLSLELVECDLHNKRERTVGPPSSSLVIMARWKMKGVLRLPWKPVVPEWTGTTTYYTDTNGLIYRHEEAWDKSVGRAFLETLCPAVARRIWKPQPEST